MVIAAVIYVSIAVLVIIAAVVLFAKALRSLKTPAIASSQRREVLAINSTELSSDLATRQEIIESLERQFRSSPSADF